MAAAALVSSACGSNYHICLEKLKEQFWPLFRGVLCVCITVLYRSLLVGIAVCMHIHVSVSVSYGPAVYPIIHVVYLSFRAVIGIPGRGML